MSTSDVGKSIREIRKDRGLTQIQLAEKTGMAVNSIRLYEAGKRIPSIDVRMELADALDCSFYDLMTEEESEAVAASAERGYWAREDELRDLGYTFSGAEKDLVNCFNKLNIHGQKEAVRNIEIIAGNPIFQRQDTPETATEGAEHKDPTQTKKPPEGE